MGQVGKAEFADAVLRGRLQSGLWPFILWDHHVASAGRSWDLRALTGARGNAHRESPASAGGGVSKTHLGPTLRYQVQTHLKCYLLTLHLL